MLEDMAPDNETANDDKRPPWGTLEELLLACAVNRHGTKRWDSIAMEVGSRRTTPLHSAFSPLTCRRKYCDLRRRFASDESSTLVDALRGLRVAELRREVQRRDVSIVSLQSKVKRLEEERERSLKEEEGRGGGGGVADLKEEVPAGDSPDTIAGNSISGNIGSFDESNSTSQKCEDRSAGGAEEAHGQAEPAAAVVHEPERTGSENRTAVPEVKSPPETMEAAEEDDDGVSVAESKRREGTKPGSDVQSSASLSRWTKRRRRRGVAAIVSSSGHSGDGEEESPASAVKFQPLVRILEIIRSHKLCSAFERRLRNQDTGRYKNLIRKHMDLATVESRLRKGLYSDCHLKFYRDLLLIFHNGVVFFRKNIPEHHAARELQALVSTRMSEARSQMEMAHQRTRILRPASTEPGAEVAAVDPKRIGAPGKPPANAKPKSESPDANVNRMSADKRTAAPKEKAKPKLLQESLKRGAAARSRVDEKPAVSGKRSRITRSGVHVLAGRRVGSDGESISGDEPGVKKKKNIQNGKIAAGTSMNKKRGAADFLKRMRQNSPNDKNKEGKSDSSDRDDNDDEDEIEEGGRRREGMRDRTRRRVTASSERREGGGRSSSSSSSRVKRAVGRPPKRSRAAAGEDGDGRRTRKRRRWGGRGVV